MPVVLLPLVVTPTAPVQTGVCTLAEIERLTAERIGPYAALEAATGSSGADVLVDALRSSIDVGGYDDLYVLRRAATSAVDRVARVKTYAPELGQLSLDRTYVDPPEAGETLELHHLDPLVLRRVARAALARCWLQFRVDLVGQEDALPGAPFVPETGAADLTVFVAPPAGAGAWLTDPGQVLAVVAPDLDHAPVPGWTAWGHAGHVYLHLGPGSVVPGTAVVCRRSHFSWVNGLDAPTGPTADDDVLSCPAAYPAALAHAEAWRVARPALEAVAAEGRQATQAEAAAEATRAAVAHAPWLFVTGGPGGRRDTTGALWGLPGAGQAGGTLGSLHGAAINGPWGTGPA